MSIEIIQQPTPHVAGVLTTPPAYLVIHGSRSGQASYTTRQEFDGTRAWCLANPDGLGWNGTLGEDVAAIHMPADRWGWHARESSQVSLGFELAQATVDVTISDGIVRSLAWLIVHYVQARWPSFDPRAAGALRMHSELPAGQRDGKTDVYPAGDARWDNLKGRLFALLAPGASDDDAKMEALWRANQQAFGGKRFAGRLDRPYYRGPVLVTDRAIITPAGLLDEQGQVDDLVTEWERARVLQRY